MSVYQRGFLDNAGFLHFHPEVIAFAGPLAYTAEHRHAAVLGGNIADQFHDDNGLADAGTAEQTDFAALGVRGDQVDDLDAGFQHFSAG